MDYEKKYNEALERAKELIAKWTGKNKDFYTEDYSYIFPELAESEDERIRKALVKQFGGCIKDEEFCHTGFTYAEITAWLEKQKEQKPVECGCTNNESEYDKGYREGHRFGLKQTQEYMLHGGKTFSGLIPCWVNAPSELQPAHKYHGRNAVIMHENNGGFRCCFIDDEKATTIHLPEDTLFVEGWRKKSVEWSEDDNKMFYETLAYLRVREENEDFRADVMHNWLKSLPERFNLLPKNEWSEEDEETINLMIAILRENHPDGLFKTNPVNTTCMSAISTDMLIKRIESLRPQPKQEWSEEDEMMLVSIISTLKPTNGAAQMKIDWLENRVKFLRPSWKPSKEQMMALEECGECKRCIKELYEQFNSRT